MQVSHAALKTNSKIIQHQPAAKSFYVCMLWAFNWNDCKSTNYTFITEIIHHDHFVQQLWRGSVDNTVNSSEQWWKSFIMKHNDDAGRRQTCRVLPVFASVHRRQQWSIIRQVNCEQKCKVQDQQTNTSDSPKVLPKTRTRPSLWWPSWL